MMNRVNAIDNIKKSQALLMSKKILTCLFYTWLFLYSCEEAFAMSPIDTGKVMLFEFIEEPPGEEDKYFLVLKDITNYVFRKEIENASFVTGFSVKKLDPLIPPEDLFQIAEEIAVLEDSDYYITGKIERHGNNLFISANWKNLKTNSTGVEKISLGKREIEDFEIVEDKVRKIAQDVIKQLGERHIEGSLGQPITILVGCFGSASDFSVLHLGRFLDLEVPFELRRIVKQTGLMTDNLLIMSLPYNDLHDFCLTGTSTDSAYKYRYHVAGSIFTTENEIFIKPVVIDKISSTPVPIEGISIDRSSGSLYNLPKIVAQVIYKNLMILLAQQSLQKKGYYSDVVDGLAGENTVEAIKKFQNDKGLTVTGKLDADTLEQLFANR